jgi:hypothetical protein
VQTLTSREQASAALKAQMFRSLLQHYINSRDTRSRLVVLELLALNFPEDFKLRPVFESWYRGLPDSHPHRAELQRIARSVADRQIAVIKGYEGASCVVELPTTRTPIAAECLGTTLAFKAFSEAGVMVSIDQGPPFEVGYFDTPLVDNSRRGELTYSLVLDRVDRTAGKVYLLAVVFPASYYPGGSKLLIDRYIGKQIEQRSAEAQQPSNTQEVHGLAK